MFVDARGIPENQALETDICIIGAGAAGITLAHEFAGRAQRVSILESGGFEFDPETHNLSTGENIGRPYFPLDVTRLRYFGGTTNHWGGICRPFSDDDFESRPWVPFSGWPFKRPALEPYYERARAICNIRSPERSTEDWLRSDRFSALPLGGPRLETRVAQTVPSAERRFAANYRNELRDAANLTVYLYANLTRFETNETGSQVTEAGVACLAGNRFKIKAKLFILAANGIENPRLLLLSNRRHAAGLGNQYDQVGRYFMEHPRLPSGVLVPTNPRTSMGLYSLHRTQLSHLGQGDMVTGYVALTEETLRNEELLDVQMDLDPVYDPAYLACADGLQSESVGSFRALLSAFRGRQIPDNFYRHVSNVLNDLSTWRRHAVAVAPIPLPRPEVISRVWDADPAERVAFLCELFGDIASAGYVETSGGPPLDHIQITTRIEQAPNPDSRVLLGREVDRLGMNKVQLNWQVSSLDRRSMIRALEILGAEAGRAGIGRLRILLNEDEPWPNTLRGGWHLMGTTRMSENPRRGVVDRNCRVHGVSNLFVAGSSVFATAGSAPPTFTIVSLAIRLADHLKEHMG
jgi:choline dehydrogenase-like flavoprotein